MSVRVSTVQTVIVGDHGLKLAKVDGDDIYIWPRGQGIGPMIAMSRDDWRRISREVMLALSSADKEDK